MTLRLACCLIVSLALAGCERSDAPTSNAAKPKPVQTAQPTDDQRFVDMKDAGEQPSPQSPLHLQVVLDRLGFAPGVIDGAEGRFHDEALRGFQRSRDLAETGKLDEDTKKALAQWDRLPALRVVRIPAGFAKGPFFADLPARTADQARYPALGYRNLQEKLAERFHTKPELLARLNPRATWRAGEAIRVPNIPEADVAGAKGEDRGWPQTLAMLGVSARQPQADHVVVDKSDRLLRVFDAQDRLIAQFPATMGSAHDPLPIGKWTIKGVSWNPPFHFNPDLFWDASSKDEKAVLKPGPNGPVGVVWIDLSKPHYGIHGTPEPENIGRSESHGCIRLSNWDAARLAQMVKTGVPAIFQP